MEKLNKSQQDIDEDCKFNQGLKDIIKEYMPAESKFYKKLKEMDLVNKESDLVKFEGAVSFKMTHVKFQKWKQRNKNNDFYQGEINSEGQRHGKGLYLKPNMCLGIGFQKNDKLHGNFIWVFVNGDRVSGTWKEGKMHGYITTQSEDGKVKIKEFW